MKPASATASSKDGITSELPPALSRIFERKKLFLKFGYDFDREGEAILEQASPLRGKILEAGTGKGHFASALAKRGLSFTSFDISKEETALAELFLKCQLLDGFADFRVEDGEHLSFADKSHDMVFSVNALHHFLQPFKVTDELARVLKSGGRFILSDFTEKGFQMLDQIHALDGNVHDKGKIAVPEIAAYLQKKNFQIQRSETLYQQTLIAEKPQ